MGNLPTPGAWQVDLLELVLAGELEDEAPLLPADEGCPVPHMAGPHSLARVAPNSSVRIWRNCSVIPSRVVQAVAATVIEAKH